MNKERILITVKTYPTLSQKYGETVCTAGIREDGSWVRLYPVPFRRLDQAEQYKKYDWIACRLQRNTSDPRPESFRPYDATELVSRAHMDTSNNWWERRQLLLRTAKVYTNMGEIIEGAKNNSQSLAIFKPTKIIDFVHEQEEREWNEAKLHQMRALYNQLDLFEDNTWRETFRIIPKLPFSFSYRFEDDSGRVSKLQILDWEIGALFWRYANKPSGEKVALEKVRVKYFDQFLSKDLHLYLGTTQQFHFVAPNPWVIIGVLPIPFEVQADLFS